MSTQQLSRRTLFAGLASLTLAGCSPPKMAALPVLKVGNQKGTVKALLTAAGVLDNLPYKIEWSEFPAAQHLLEALAAGAVDVGLVGDAPYLFAFAAGSPLKVVSALTYGDGSSTALIVPKESPIRSVKDLRGKRVATGKISVGQYLLLRALEANGLNLHDIQPVYMAPSDAKAAFASGQIDAWSTWSPFLATAIVKDGARVIASGKGLMSSHAYQVATPDAIAHKLPQLRDFIARQNTAYVWAGSHQPEYAAALSRDTGLPSDVALAMVRDIRPSVAPLDDTLIAEAGDVVKHLAAASDETLNPPPIAQAFAAEFRSA